MLELDTEKGTNTLKIMAEIKESRKQRKQPRVMETHRQHMRVDRKKEKQFMTCGLTKKEALRQKEMCNERCGICAYMNML